MRWLAPAVVIVALGAGLGLALAGGGSGQAARAASAPVIRDALPTSQLHPLARVPRGLQSLLYARVPRGLQSQLHARVPRGLQSQLHALVRSLPRTVLGGSGRHPPVPPLPGPPDAGTTCFVAGVGNCSLHPCVEFVATSSCTSPGPLTAEPVMQSVPSVSPAVARLP